MGLYSTNRVSGLTEATDIELVPDSNFGDIMECNVQLVEHERMMFESLLELDFVSATNEAVLTEAEAEEKNKAANETKKVKITEKIAQLIDNAIAAIKKAFANFIAKFQQIANDSVVKKYIEALKKDGALDGFKGIKDFAMPSDFVFCYCYKYDNDKKELEKTKREDVIDMFSTLDGLNSAEEIKSYAEEFNKAIEEDIQVEDELIDYFEEKKETFIPSKKDILKAVTMLSNSVSAVKDIKRKLADEITILNKIKRELKSNRKSSSNEVEVAKNKAKYDIVVEYIKFINTDSKKSFEIAKRQIAACRKLIILSGKYALSKNKGKSKEDKTTNAEETVNSESALDYIIGESSDQYVYNVFAN